MNDNSRKMSEEVRSLEDQFNDRGVWKAGRLLLPPSDALRFLASLERLGVGVLALQLWYYTEPDEKKGLAEYIGSPYYTALALDPDFVSKSANLARTFIRGQLPDYIGYIGFVY